MHTPVTESEMSVEAALAELREMFLEHEYIRIRVECQWFGSGTFETLARIVVTKYEWSGKSLNEAMSEVRKWKQEQS